MGRQELDDVVISRGIITKYFEELNNYLDSEVAIVGGGPAGITSAYYLAKAGVKVALFDRKLTIGGGMWGGGMMFNQIVVQEEGRRILDEFGVRYSPYVPGYYLADSVGTVSTLVSKAVWAGAKFFNLMNVEDLVITNDRVSGLVLNWSPVDIAGLHVDPLSMRASYVVDATGHPTEVVQTLVRKMGVELNTPSGKIEGEKSMWAERGEQSVVEFTREIYPGLFVAGMAAIASYGGYRMGPIFGGMLLSGELAAKMLVERLRQTSTWI